MTRIVLLSVLIAVGFAAQSAQTQANINSAACELTHCPGKA